MHSHIVTPNAWASSQAAHQIVADGWGRGISHGGERRQRSGIPLVPYKARVLRRGLEASHARGVDVRPPGLPQLPDDLRAQHGLRPARWELSPHQPVRHLPVHQLRAIVIRHEPGGGDLMGRALAKGKVHLRDTITRSSRK